MHKIIIIIWWWLKNELRELKIITFITISLNLQHIPQLSRFQIVNGRILRKVHKTPYGFSLKHETSLEF
jgi:hypothetical protein